jgi:hypothetical protein
MKDSRELALALLELEIAIDELARIRIDPEVENPVHRDDDGEEPHHTERDTRSSVDGGDPPPAYPIHPTHAFTPRGAA